MFILKWQKKRVVFVCGMCPRQVYQSSRDEELKPFDLPVWAVRLVGITGVQPRYGDDWYIRQHPSARKVCVRYRVGQLR
jgi:hypothetical protein